MRRLSFVCVCFLFRFYLFNSWCLQSMLSYSSSTIETSFIHMVRIFLAFLWSSTFASDLFSMKSTTNNSHVEFIMHSTSMFVVEADGRQHWARPQNAFNDRMRIDTSLNVCVYSIISIVTSYHWNWNISELPRHHWEYNAKYVRLVRS
jgi:hypothetical protein